MNPRPSLDLPLAQSECIAIRAWAFLNRDGRAGPEVEARALPRETLTKALDALITNEKALQAFAALIDVPPEAAYEARRRLFRSG